MESMDSMDSAFYLSRVLENLQPTHDIIRDYPANGQVLPAYARYESTSEKYVLSRKASLWKATEHEHVLFITLPEQTSPDESAASAAVDTCDGSAASAAVDFPDGLYGFAHHLIADYMEPALARGGEKYPPVNHMRTFLTVVFLSDGSPSADLVRRIRKYRFDRGYKFSFRGYAQGRIVFVDLSAGKVYTSPAAKDIAGFYDHVLKSQKKGV